MSDNHHDELGQGLVYDLEAHPLCPDFVQCVPFKFFESRHIRYGLAMYNIGHLVGFFGIPLVIIVYCYAVIIKALMRQSSELDSK